MIAVESRAGRRVIGRLDRGVDLFEALLSICRTHKIATGEIRALGSLEAVELAEYDQAGKAWKAGRKFAGGFEVLQLSGNVSEKDGQLAMHAHATLMRDRDSGIEMLGGHIVSGRVFALEFVIDAFDDVLLRRGVDEPTGLTQWREGVALTPPPSAAAAGAPDAPMPRAQTSPATVPPPPAAPPPVPPVGSTWADVAAASAKAPPPVVKEEPAGLPPEYSDPVIPGDTIIHPKFGRCEVLRVEGADEFAHVRLSSGRMVRLALDVLDLTVDSRDGKKRIFRARVE